MVKMVLICCHRVLWMVNFIVFMELEMHKKQTHVTEKLYRGTHFSEYWWRTCIYYLICNVAKCTTVGIMASIFSRSQPLEYSLYTRVAFVISSFHEFWHFYEIWWRCKFDNIRFDIQQHWLIFLISSLCSSLYNSNLLIHFLLD